MTTIQPGDHVYIGAAEHGKVHWEVVGIIPPRQALLRSPMSGRHQFEYIENLTLHTRGNQGRRIAQESA